MVRATKRLHSTVQGLDAEENDYKVFMYNLVIPPVSPTPPDVEITSKAAPHESADDSSKLSKIVAQLASLQKDFNELAHEKWMNSSQSEQKHAAFAVSPVPQSGGPHILKIIIHKKDVGGVIGQKGAHLRQLETDSHCNIRICSPEEYHPVAVDLRGRTWMREAEKSGRPTVSSHDQTITRRSAFASRSNAPALAAGLSQIDNV